MRKLFAKLLLGLAILTAAAFGADSSLGTWKLNVAKSKFTPAPFPYKNLTLVREAAAGGVKLTVTGARADGSAVNSTWTAKYDGTPAKVTGAGVPFDTTTTKQIDANTFTSEWTKAGTPYHTSVKTTISKDGKTLTSISEGTGADGKPISSKLVYEKQ
jgi:hypothetical protein